MTINADGSVSIQIDLSNFCPNNCSSHGECSSTDATCICETNYSGADCSQYSLALPQLVSTTQEGTFDLSTGSLSDIVFKTKRYIISNPAATVRFTVFVRVVYYDS